MYFELTARNGLNFVPFEAWTNPLRDLEIQIMPKNGGILVVIWDLGTWVPQLSVMVKGFPVWVIGHLSDLYPKKNGMVFVEDSKMTSPPNFDPLHPFAALTNSQDEILLVCCGS